MSALKKVDFGKLAATLRPDTVAALNTFRRRHADLTKKIGELREAQTSVDFAAYRAVLQNKKIVNDAEKAFQLYQPRAYSLAEQLRAIDAQEAKAVAAAQATEARINQELAELKDLLVNIETARPIDQLTVDDVVQAVPEIDAVVEKMAKRNQWRVPGYYEKFGEFRVGF
ncbi:ATP synthase d subunit [Physocladia obscura]|uniref:ATP synthase subunit d, mitochondrial n=1 Tax=Physocladia obscura TaxID=109957 RepID=A0AAD5XEY5_9FUNG|nr:ATP synthase d subunit [Physocladia obscura]